MESSKQTRQVILRLLNNLGSQKEVQQYLKKFSALETDKFAIVKVGGEILQQDIAALSSSLAFLQQVGLAPIIVHGAGPQLNQTLASEGIESRVLDGLRVTTPEVLKLARRVFQAENLRLVDALRDAGVRATSITSGVFEAELLDREKYGMVGKITGVHMDLIRAALRAQSMPVISPFAETVDGQILNVNADMATSELVHAAQPFKIIFLTGTGGILDHDGNLISSINLSTDYQHLMSSDWLHSGMRLKLQQVHDMLLDLPHSSSVSITHPAMLAKELFTYRGSGTLVRYGENIQACKNWSDVDQGRLKNLLEASFQKTLSDDYFESTDLAAVFVSDSYRAAAVIVQEEDIVRLDKFSVTEEAQGEGLGRSVWEQVRESYPAMYWRARPGNPINQFYFQQADGCIKGSRWNIFWYGVDDYQHIQALVERANQAPITLT
jgi:acetylglutamate kinase